jgi:methyl-accepting chemotaxis protein/methyl-accepting chemotaxis protein-1 (serine sensor receptor)
MTIGRRIAVLAAVQLLLMMVLGLVSWFNLAGVDRRIATLTGDALPGLQYAGEITSALYHFRGDTWMHIASTSPERMAKIEQNLAADRRGLEQALDSYEKTAFAAEDKQNLARMRQLFQAYAEVWEREIFSISRAGRNEEASALADAKMYPKFVEMNELLKKMADWNSDYALRASSDATTTVATIQTWTLVLLVSGLVIGIGLAVFFQRGIAGALRQVSSKLGASASQLTDAAMQVSDSSQSLAQGANEQAASLEETSASTEEINSMARRNTENSQSVAKLLDNAQQKFAETDTSLQHMVTAMNDINASSEKISKIIKVIDEIAFQTNILALNAAVEAARAGEAGMGFAVVADEVRSLAQRCAQAAKDTSGLIEESIRRANEGKTKVDQVAVSFHSIAADADSMKTLADEVHISSEEQARGIGQIAQAITQIEQVTQRAAAGAEEGASAAEELNSQSEVLKSIVAELTTLVGR